MAKNSTWKCDKCDTQGNTKSQCEVCESPAPSRVRLNR